MLNQRIDITTATPPLLQVMPDNSWHIILRVEQVTDHTLKCSCLKEDEGVAKQFSCELSEAPFHVGADIWEMSYGVQIMTLMHESLCDHPARRLWQRWQSQQ